MKQKTTGTFNPTLTTQSKPQSEFVYVSSSQPSAIVMISTQYQELPEKQKLELLKKLQEWIDNKQTEMEIKDMTPQQKAQEIYNKLVVHIQRYDEYVDDRSKFKTIQCASIAVDEMISVLTDLNGIYNITPALTYWQEVKQEIEKL